MRNRKLHTEEKYRTIFVEIFISISQLTMLITAIVMFTQNRYEEFEDITTLLLLICYLDSFRRREE